MIQSLPRLYSGLGPARAFAALVLLVLGCWPVFRLDEVYGLALFLAGLPLVLLLLPSPLTLFTRVLTGYGFVAGVAAYAWTTEVLAGPDEIGYFAQVDRFHSVGSFFSHIAEVLGGQWLLGTAFLSFPILYLPFFGFYGLEAAESIAALNALFWLLSVIITAACAHRFLKPRYPELSVGLACSLALLSPSAMYFASIFAKDTASAFLCVLTVLCLLRRRYVVAVALLYLATMLRPYSIGIVVLYLLVFRASLRTLALTVAAAAASVVVLTGFRPVVLVNIVLIEGFFFLSPNPLNPENWQGHLATLAVEGVFLGAVGIVSALVFLGMPRSRPLYLRLLLGTVIYAAILTLVGYKYLEGRDMLYGYGLGSAGDNMMRKKLPIIPLIYLYAAVTLRYAADVVLSCCRDRTYRGAILRRRQGVALAAHAARTPLRAVADRA
jgi:hypothetical protein